nr:4Fe-4S dicluster domain-containing protein [Methanosarcina sp. 2.H.T.1A.8]
MESRPPRFWTGEQVDNAEGEKVLYSGLEVQASNCTECGQCEDKCPQKTPLG